MAWLSRINRPLLIPFLTAGFFTGCKARPDSIYGKNGIFPPTAGQPSNPPLVAAGLVDIRKRIPSVIVRLAYATPENALGRALYPPDMPVYLHPKTARKLARAVRILESQGFRLIIWDAWRPPEAHLQLWSKARESGFVSVPSGGWSRHCSGTAVDVTLADKDGKLVPMPSGFDDFTGKGHAAYLGGDPVIRRNLRTLQSAMVHSGFSTMLTEWWHFSDRSIRVPPTHAHQLSLELP